MRKVYLDTTQTDMCISVYVNEIAQKKFEFLDRTQIEQELKNIERKK